MNPSPLLDIIDTPQDLRRLEKKQLPQVAAELREFLLDSVGKTGGHFASNLGAVELTVALHYVYDTPEDHLVWDVGHQSYPHKILTGRKNQMHTMRQYGGLAGFPKRSESEYDAFGVGHSSTSIGAALGMAVADKQLGNNRRSVAIIGDGAMTAGQAFEALNCAGDMDVDLLVILNDNEMSISPNVGALPKYLASNVVRDMHGLLSTIKAQSSKVLDKLPGAMELAQKVENKIKTLAGEAEHAKQSLSLFENFGFRYTGPVDGHNVENLVDVLKDLRGRKGPQLLHVITKKGNGYKFAENDPVKYHAVAKLPSEVPAPEVKPAAAKPTYTQVFGQWLCDQAAADERLVAITPAMREGSGLVEFEQQFPDRYFDVGIAEQHAVTFAGGLACEGIKPVVAIYSTFLQRAYDQLVHDVALQNLPVLFAIDRAGIVGADGPTHARFIPILSFCCWSVPEHDYCRSQRRKRMPPAALNLLSGKFAVRRPLSARTGTGATVSDGLETVEIGKGIIRREGEKIAVIAFGSMVAPSLTAADKLNATVADMRFVKPIDEELIVHLARSHDYIVTVEENAEQGGAGSAVLEVLAKHGICKPVLLLGVEDKVTEHGDPKKLLDDLDLSAEAIENALPVG